MNDNEYYSSSELWPQPPDVRPTLEESVSNTSGTSRKKPENSKKRRKKLTDSLSSLFIGAVAIVMVATAIIPNKDDEDVGLGGPSEEDFCQVCRELDCPYWVYGSDGGAEGLSLSLDSHFDSSAEVDYLYMSGTDVDLFGYRGAEYCLYTQEGVRLFLNFDPYQLPIPVSGCGAAYEWYGNNGAVPSAGTSAVNLSMTLYGDTSALRGGVEEEEVSGEMVVQLIYAPDGQIPEENYGLFGDKVWPYVYTEVYEGASSVWIRVYTDISQNVCEAAVDCCSIITVYGDGLVYYLGDTMLFQENETVGRLWNDSSANACSYHFSIGEKPVAFRVDFDFRTYSVWSTSDEAQICVIHGDTFSNLMKKWQDLNAELPKGGHEEIFHVKELSRYTYNGVNYDAYYIWYGEDVVMGSSLMLIPVQEENIAVMLELLCCPYVFELEQIQNVDTLLQNREEDFVYVHSLLAQLSLRDGADSDIGYGDDPDIGYEDDATQDTEDREVCSFCKDPDCPYFLIGYDVQGLQVTMENENIPYADALEMMHMDGSILKEHDATQYTTYLNTDNQTRLLLEVNPQEFPFTYDYFWSYDAIFGSAGTESSEGPGFVALDIEFANLNVQARGGEEEEFSPGRMVFQLVYGADDDPLTQEYTNAYTGQFLYVCSKPVAGMDDVWLYVFNNVSSELGLKCADLCRIHTMDVNQMYQLGETMLFLESGNIVRSWNDTFSLNMGTTPYRLDAQENEVQTFFTAMFFTRKYNISCLGQNVRLISFASSFTDIASQWNRLNADAPAKGHDVIFHLDQMDDHVHNGITYDVYAAWYQSTEGKRVTLFMVPEQEDHIAVTFEMYAEDDWQSLDALLADAGQAEVVEAMLDQIELK